MGAAVDFSEGVLSGRMGSERFSVPVQSVERVLECSMEDEIHHGEELFHILVMTDQFCLVGPFVEGGLVAVESLKAAGGSSLVSQVTVGHVPRRYRAPGQFGLKLFPVPGLGLGPLSDLKDFSLDPPWSAEVQTR